MASAEEHRQKRVKSYSRSEVSLKSQIDDLMIRGQFVPAEKLLKEALQKAPDNPDLLEAMATVSLSVGENQRADTMSKRAYELAPQKDKIVSTRLTVLQTLNRPDEVHRILETRLDREISSVEELYADVLMLDSLRKKALARKFIDSKIPALGPLKTAEARRYYALSLHFSGQSEKALPILKACLKECPECPDYYHHVSGVLCGLQRYAEALSVCQGGIKKCPTDQSLVEMRANIYRLQKKDAEAIRDYSSLLSIKEKAANRLARMLIYQHTGDDEKACCDSEILGKTNPRSSNLSRTIVIRLKQKKWLKAAEDLDTGIRYHVVQPDLAYDWITENVSANSPDSHQLDGLIARNVRLAPLYVIRGVQRRERGRPIEALDNFDKAIQFQPLWNTALDPVKIKIISEFTTDEITKLIGRSRADKQFHEVLSGRYFRQKQYGDALRELDFTSPEKASDPMPLQRRARCLCELGKRSEAIKDLDILVEKWHQIGDIKVRAALLLKTGNNERAAEEFAKLIKKEPDIPRYYFNRARALEALGRVEEAQQVRQAGRAVLDSWKQMTR